MPETEPPAPRPRPLPASQRNRLTPLRQLWRPQFIHHLVVHRSRHQGVRGESLLGQFNRLNPCQTHQRRLTSVPVNHTARRTRHARHVHNPSAPAPAPPSAAPPPVSVECPERCTSRNRRHMSCDMSGNVRSPTCQRSTRRCPARRTLARRTRSNAEQTHPRLRRPDMSPPCPPQIGFPTTFSAALRWSRDYHVAPSAGIQLRNGAADPRLEPVTIAVSLEQSCHSLCSYSAPLRRHAPARPAVRFLALPSFLSVISLSVPLVSFDLAFFSQDANNTLRTSQMRPRSLTFEF